MDILHVCSIDWHKTHGLCLTGEAVISNTRVTCDHHTRLFSNLAHCSSVSVLFEHRYSLYAYHFNIFVSYNISNMCIVWTFIFPMCVLFEHLYSQYVYCLNINIPTMCIVWTSVERGFFAPAIQSDTLSSAKSSVPLNMLSINRIVQGHKKKHSYKKMCFGGKCGQRHLELWQNQVD